MLIFVPFRLNPERIGGDFKQEVQVRNLFMDETKRSFDKTQSHFLYLLMVTNYFRFIVAS